MSAPIEMAGRRFGRWLTVRRVIVDGRKSRKWLCRCDCGTEREVDGPALRRGCTTSCGCYGHYILGNSTRTHGKTRTRVYRIWSLMRRRCQDPTNPKYPRYGGRGIKVCAEWQEFSRFLADMGEPTTPTHSIERNDVNGNYEPANCRWATPLEQSNNTTTNRRITHNGETLTLSQWARRCGVSHNTISDRIFRGWPMHRVMSGPERIPRNRKTRTADVGAA